jgi:hypothetical protein
MENRSNLIAKEAKALRGPYSQGISRVNKYQPVYRYFNLALYQMRLHSVLSDSVLYISMKLHK